MWSLAVSMCTPAGSAAGRSAHAPASAAVKTANAALCRIIMVVLRRSRGVVADRRPPYIEGADADPSARFVGNVPPP